MKEVPTLTKKISRVANKAFHKWLRSDGDKFAILADKTMGRTTITIVLSCGFTIGNRKFRRQVQRSFSVNKPTRVPSVLLNSFLEDPMIREVSDAR